MLEAEPSSAPTDGERRFLTFLLNDSLYALPAGEVAEVIRTPAVARMPQAPAALIGIANLRGSVLPLVSLRCLLGQKETRDEGPRSIVLGGKSPAALAVDAVEALVTVAAKRVETRQAERRIRARRLLAPFMSRGEWRPRSSTCTRFSIAPLRSAANASAKASRPPRRPAGEAR